VAIRPNKAYDTDNTVLVCSVRVGALVMPAARSGHRQ
jgi:hypothetical protein